MKQTVKLPRRDDVVKRCAQNMAEQIEGCKAEIAVLLNATTCLPVDVPAEHFGEGAVRNEVLRQMKDAGYDVKASADLKFYTVK